MVFWKSRSRTSRALKCFYCNQFSTVETTSGRRPRNWECPLCAAMNFMDEDGSIADTIPQEYQAKASQTSTRSRNSVKPATLRSPFCSICTSNQALLVQTLANYLPDENDPDIAVYERALPAYKASLEERYPTTCPSCAPKIQERLQRNNYIAKSTALGNFLKSTRSTSRTAQGTGLFKRTCLSLLATVRGILWFSASGLMLHWFVMGVLFPANQKYGVLRRHELLGRHEHSISGQDYIPTTLVSQEFVAWYYTFVRRWYVIFLAGTMWHPKLFQVIWADNVKLQGKEDYSKLQIMIQALRLSALFLYPYQWISSDMHMKFSVILTFLSVIHFATSFLILEVEYKAKVSMRDTSISLQDMMQNEIDTVQEELPRSSGLPDDLFEESKLPPGFLADSDDEQHHATTAQKSIEQDAMDWQASPSADDHSPSRSPFATARESVTTALPRMFPTPVFPQPKERYFSSNAAQKLPFSLNDSRASRQVGLAPQKFFAPERPTGLENLFSAAVRLDDEPLLVRSIKSVQRTPQAATWVLLGLAGTLAPLLYLRYFQVLAIGGEILLVAATSLGIFKGRLRWCLALWPIAWSVSYVLSKSEHGLIIIYASALTLQLVTQSLPLRQVPKPKSTRKRPQHSHFKRA